MLAPRVCGLLLLATLLMAVTGVVVAADRPQPSLASASAAPAGAQVLSVVAAAAGTIAYAPFKAVLVCPFMAVASGISQVFASRGTAGYLLDVGCRGSYVVTPEMLRGQEEFRGAGPTLPKPEPLRPVQTAS